jgi:hypothetical protein
VTKASFHDPALAPGSVSKSIFKQTNRDLPAKHRFDKWVGVSASEDGGAMAGHKRKPMFARANLAKLAPSSDSTTKSQTPEAPRGASVPKAASPSETTRSMRKRKSDEIAEATAEPAATSERPSFIQMKRSRLNVTRQFKRRKPARPAHMLRESARITRATQESLDLRDDVSAAAPDPGSTDQEAPGYSDTAMACDEQPARDKVLTPAPTKAESTKIAAGGRPTKMKAPSNIVTGTKSFVEQFQVCSYTHA